MSKKLIIGAGLSGMTAGICLAREGYEVEIWDRVSAIGGIAQDQKEKAKRTIAIGDMTPFDIEKLSNYLGFDLMPDKEKNNRLNYFAPLPYARFFISGARCDMHFPKELHMNLIERGPRPSSLDSMLYRTALEAGVKFRFNMVVESKKDFSELPSGSIIATGMYRKTFVALDIPFEPAHGFFAYKEIKNYKGPETIVYLDKHTKDYGYFTIINGIGATIIFQRKATISEETQEWFPRRLKEDAGLDFTDWKLIENFVGTPTKSMFNPRLFHDRFILTGTLAGFQDPSFVMGVHGALISGRIAAIAVKDKKRALKEFRRMNRWWRFCYLGKKFLNATHPYSLKLIYKPIISSRARFLQRYLWFLYPSIPGLRRI